MKKKMITDYTRASVESFVGKRRGTHLVGTIDHVYDEQLEVEVLPSLRVLVQLGQVHEDMVVYRAVEQTHGNDGQDRPEGVPEQQIRVFKNAAK